MESSSKYIYTHEAIIGLNNKHSSLPRDVLQQLKGFHLLKGDPGPKRTKLISSKEQPLKNFQKGPKEKMNSTTKNLSSTKEKSLPGKQELNKKKAPINNNIPPQANKEDVKPVSGEKLPTVVATPLTNQRIPLATITKPTVRSSTSYVPLIKQGINNKVVNNNNKENMVNTQTIKPNNSTGKSLLGASQTMIKNTNSLISAKSVQQTRSQPLKPSVPTLKPTSLAFKPAGLKGTEIPNFELIISPLELTQQAEEPVTLKKRNAENDPRRLEQRQKQIEYGYKTIGYQNFISKVPKNGRGPKDPVTPRKNQKCSKRSWDGQIRKWRRELHQWDPETQEEKNHFIALIKETYGEEPSENIPEEPSETMVGGSISEEEQQIFLVHAKSSYVNLTAVESV